ncbi:MAG: EAL domain-containing protein [Azonexus sp.]|nr:EAL domain-containing protein [Azonexus sp.]
MTTSTAMPTEIRQQQALEEALKICASEPIHLVGTIQPVGVLLAVDCETLLIRAASQNLSSIFPGTADQVIGKPLCDLIGNAQLGWVETMISLGPWEGAKVWSVSLPYNGKIVQHDAQVFVSGDLFVIEVEHRQPPSGDVFHKLFIPIRDALWKLDSEADLGRYAQMAVEQVRVLTGFDRVMMYRFDNNWDGEVIAECKAEEADSYLGNRFPASDIPPQARELYTRNLVRVIADVNAEPVPLVSAGSTQPVGSIDLSHSWLRSMSPVHVEYLRNMGVCASLSISLVQNDRLWGLIACHHMTPKYVGLRSREMDEFIGRVVSLKLINMDNMERESLNRSIRDVLYDLTELIRSSHDLDSVIALLKDKLLGLVRSAGAVLVIDGTRHLLGEVPSEPVMDRLLDVLRERPAAPVFSTDDLARLFLEAGSDVHSTDGVSGLLVAPLDHQMNNFVMWFRQGILRTLRWAGNPQKSMVRDASGVYISPRTSFETWIQTYQDKSLPWSQAEIDAANSLSMALIEVLAQKALKSSEESYRLLAENSTDMIARLEMNGSFRFASPACRELFGRESEQLVGLNLADVVQESAESMDALIFLLKPLGAMTTRVMRGKRLDGLDLWVEATLKHILGAHGESEILLNARDVTQRYNYQLAIEDVHRRHTQILEAAGEGLVSLNKQGYVVYANEVAAKLLGRDEDDLVGEYCCEVFCWSQAGKGDHSAHVACPFIATLQDGETRQGIQTLGSSESRAPLKAQYVCTPLLENERISGCVVVFGESASKAAGDHSAATEVILDEAAEAVMVTDAAGRITSVNRAFTEITGYGVEEALGQSPRLLKSGVHTPHFYDDLWRVLTEKRRWVGEVWNRRKNGEIYPQWGSISAILDNAGKLQNYVAVFSDISKAKQAEERLFHMANHDTLTNLPNRMNFTESLAQTIQRCKRHNCGAAVVFIDLDRFKIINDTLGHAVGDKYLKAVSERLLVATRKQDLLARWGGDEFVLVMEGIDDLHAIGEALSRMLLQLAEPIHLAGHELIPTASIGIAMYPNDGRHSAELIKAADTAMYGAKQRGRNCFEFYSKEMAQDLGAKLQMSSELRHALQEQQFFLVYQPQVDPRSGVIKGVEALSRWRHPVRGVLPPVAFIPMIEEMGLIGELGQWVLNEACRQMKEWSDHSVPVPKVSINVAPSQLKDSFVVEVDHAIRKWQIRPNQLELEITEGALESGELARKITAELRALGVTLAVDDFGTGYSSLSHLKMFPITCFKIDKSFVDGIPGNGADVAIVRTILALGASFNVEVVAEGAETLGQVDFLKAEGVTNIQGFHFARPMSPEHLEQWLH